MLNKDEKQAIEIFVNAKSAYFENVLYPQFKYQKSKQKFLASGKKDLAVIGGPTGTNFYYQNQVLATKNDAISIESFPKLSLNNSKAILKAVRIRDAIQNLIAKNYNDSKILKPLATKLDLHKLEQDSALSDNAIHISFIQKASSTPVVHKSVSTEEAAAEWGLTNRNLKGLLADFYLLNDAVEQSKIENKEVLSWVVNGRFREFTRRIAKEFASYLNAAVGGEIRYSNWGKDTYQKHGTPAPNRGLAWKEWKAIRAQQPEALRQAIVAFNKMSGSGVGGKTWGAIATTLDQFETKTINDVTFVDTAFGLQHNGGCAFNKWYDTQGVIALLDTVRKGELKALIPYASEDVINLYMDCGGFKRGRAALLKVNWSKLEG